MTMGRERKRRCRKVEGGELGMREGERRNGGERRRRRTEGGGRRRRKIKKEEEKEEKGTLMQVRTRASSFWRRDISMNRPRTSSLVNGLPSASILNYYLCSCFLLLLLDTRTNQTDTNLASSLIDMKC